MQNFKKDTIIHGKSLKMKCDFLVYTILLKICVLLESPLSFIWRTPLNHKMRVKKPQPIFVNYIWKSDMLVHHKTLLSCYTLCATHSIIKKIDRNHHTCQPPFFYTVVGFFFSSNNETILSVILKWFAGKIAKITNSFIWFCSTSNQVCIKE